MEWARKGRGGIKAVVRKQFTLKHYDRSIGTCYISGRNGTTGLLRDVLASVIGLVRVSDGSNLRRSFEISDHTLSLNTDVL